MRIIDKNKDFYDYLQRVYPDDTVTFDRRNSFILSKEDLLTVFSKIICHKWNRCYLKNICGYELLQVCNTFWFFRVNFLEIVDEYPYEPYIKDYKLELIDNWKDYNASRKLINLSISVGFLKEEKIIKENLLHTKNPKLNTEINSSLIYYYNKEKHENAIPILKDTGIAAFIDPLEIYLSLDEYFSKEITESERTESIGITDKEKIINHGFNIKNSFRGKYKKNKKN